MISVAAQQRQAVFYSIGHSSLAAEAFVSYLNRFGVRCVADVRRFPTSRRHPQFDREALEQTLSGAGIDYVYLGDELGGYRDDPYEVHAQSRAFATGLARLVSLGADEPTAFMCAEKLPWHCHRRFIARALEGEGLAVRHIVDGQLML